jgi:YjjG family noncanonical pyrimidine nucleotidase
LKIKPQHIFFDLDHTLWDYETNSIATIHELLVEFAPQIGREMAFEEFYPIYFEHNHVLWSRYRHNEIDNLTLRYERWRMTFADFGIAEAGWMYDMSEAFLEQCPRKPGLMPNALFILDLVREHYPLHLITNGFSHIQDLKLAHSGLRQYFDVIVTPDGVGEKKPHPKIFQEALAAADCTPENALYIGDSYAEDVIGGHGAGMQVVYFNPKGKENPAGFPEIQDLMELRAFLDL